MIREEFFSGEGIKQFKHLDHNKSLKTIVYFVFNIVTYVLLEEQENKQEGKGSNANKKKKHNLVLDNKNKS